MRAAHVLVLSLLVACGGGGSDEPEGTSGAIPTTYAGTSEILSLAFEVPSPDAVDETVTLEVDGTDVFLATAFCDLYGTDYTEAGDRALVTFDKAASSCSFDVDSTPVELAITSGLINWDAEELSVLVNATGTHAGTDFEAIVQFDGVAE